MSSQGKYRIVFPKDLCLYEGVKRVVICFGFYTENEIRRRRSLRLQGLDPENEGLTWGTRKRQSSRKSGTKLFISGTRTRARTTS